MRALGVQGVTRRKRWSTTCRDRRAQVALDRVQLRFEAGRPDQLRVTDITRVLPGEGFVFLAMVLDVFSRKIVGWAMGSRETVELVQAALAIAGDNRGTPTVVLHSDQGSQYPALAFTRQCLAAGIERSMGTPGSRRWRLGRQWIQDRQRQAVARDGPEPKPVAHLFPTAHFRGPRRQKPILTQVGDGWGQRSGRDTIRQIPVAASGVSS